MLIFQDLSLLELSMTYSNNPSKFLLGRDSLAPFHNCTSGESQLLEVDCCSA